MSRMEAAGLPGRLMVDCSHSNSGRRTSVSRSCGRALIEQRGAGNRGLNRAMLEGNLLEGRQDLTADPSSLRYGVSITDACVGWDETEQLLRQAWERLRL